MIEAFQFEDRGRTYECSVEAPRNAPKEARWWVSISDDRQRYSPFEAASSDTKANVKARVIAFYNHRLARIAVDGDQLAGQRLGDPATAAHDGDAAQFTAHHGRVAGGAPGLGDDPARQLPRGRPVPGVVRRLSAAGLGAWHFDPASGLFQQFDRGEPD